MLDYDTSATSGGQKYQVLANNLFIENILLNIVSTPWLLSLDFY